jgi:LPXTG-site transpeptidase (sortase) family protein
MRFERLVTLRERFVTLWDASTPVKRGLIVGIPVVVLALAGTGIGFAAFHGGGGSSAAQAHAAPTSSPTHAATPTLQPTETPASAGVQTPVPPPPGGGAPSGSYTRVQPHAGTGPGAAKGTGMSLSVPAANINAGVYSRTVGTNGVMGNPSGAWDVIWYDFSTFSPGVGGYPGAPGANAVFAGHVDYIHVGPAVFWNLKDLQPGARVTVNTPNGPVNYQIQWSKWAGPDEDFGPYVSQTGQEIITLVTCIGDFSNGHYSNRLIVRGVRV